jgi:hypothetical protein
LLSVKEFKKLKMNKQIANLIIDALQADGITEADRQLRILNYLDSRLWLLLQQYDVSGSLPPDTTGWLIHHNDKVNSVLGAALRFLNEEQMILLKDCLIERTPKAMTS